jgi:hypothetical protein
VASHSLRSSTFLDAMARSHVHRVHWAVPKAKAKGKDHGKGGKNMAAKSSGIAVHEHGKGGKNTDEQAEPESDSEEMGSASPPSMTAAEVAAVEAQWATAVIDGGDDDLMDYMLGD